MRSADPAKRTSLQRLSLVRREKMLQNVAAFSLR
jgi:hypothetical protein